MIEELRSDATNHIIDASEDDGGKLGSVAPLRDEGEGEAVHKQLMTYSQIIANIQLVFNYFLHHEVFLAK